MQMGGGGHSTECPRTVRTIFAQSTLNTSASDSKPSPPCSAASCSRSRPCCGRPATTSPRSRISLYRTGYKICSTNPLKRLNKEVKRRTDVVGGFPNPPPCSGWLARSSSRLRTNGGSPTYATSSKPHLPCSKKPSGKPEQQVATSPALTAWLKPAEPQANRRLHVHHSTVRDHGSDFACR
jgi:hypothetical protein